MAERCDFTDLLTDECAHCTGRTGEPERGDVEVAYRFTAAYRGKCDHCDRRIDAGDQLIRTTDHDLICEECADVA